MTQIERARCMIPLIAALSLLPLPGRAQTLSRAQTPEDRPDPRSQRAIQILYDVERTSIELGLRDP